MATQTTRQVRAMRYEKAAQLPTWTLLKVLYKRHEVELLYTALVVTYTAIFLHKIGVF